jgi:primosomal protein N'
VELVTNKVPHLLVLERQAALIQAMEQRVALAMEKERKLLRNSDPAPMLTAEIRESMALLARMYHDHFKTLQESGLEPKAAQKVETAQPLHGVFQFLRPEEALRLKRVQDEVDAGRLDVLELYKAAGPIFKVEQEAADRPGPPPAGSR